MKTGRHALAAVAIALMIAACSYTHEPEVAVPPKAAFWADERLPIAMGVYYSPGFLAQTHREVCAYAPEILLTEYMEASIGQRSAATFDRVLDAYFERALRFAERPSAARPAAGVDAVLLPEIENIAPARGLDFRFRLVDPAGRQIAAWAVQGQEKNVVRFVDGKVVSDSTARSNIGVVPFCDDVKAHRLSVMLEDAGRNFVKEFPKQPEIRRWLLSRGIQVAEPHPPLGVGLPPEAGG